MSARTMTTAAARRLLDRIDGPLPPRIMADGNVHCVLELTLRERNLLADALDAYLDMHRKEDDE